MEFIDELVEEDFASLKQLMVDDDEVWLRTRETMDYWRNAEEGADLFPTTATVVKHIYRSEPYSDGLYEESSDAHGRVQKLKADRAEQNRQRKEVFLQQIDAATTVGDFPPDLVGRVRAQLSPIGVHRCAPPRDIKNAGARKC